MEQVCRELCHGALLLINKIKNPSRYMKLKNATKKWSAEQINDILRNPFYCRKYNNK